MCLPLVNDKLGSGSIELTVIAMLRECSWVPVAQ